MGTIYLANGILLGSGLQSSIGSQVQQLFQELIQRAGQMHVTCAWTEAEVRWIEDICPTLAATDLLVRFQNPPASAGGANSCTAQGYQLSGHTTWTGQLMRSVVYVPHCPSGVSIPAAALGKLAFHEAMHNKLRMTDAQLHPRGGLASASLEASTTMTDDNVRLFAPALGNARPQNTSDLSCI
jgi:hypothetical protein